MKNKINISINLDEISNNLNEAIAFLKVNKVKFTEIRTVDGKNIVDYDLPEIERIARIMFRNGLKISAIASPLFKWYLDPKGGRVRHDNFSFNPVLSEKQKKEYILKIIKIAKILRTKYVRVFSNLKQKGLQVQDLYKDSTFEFMLQEFSNAGLVPLLENEPVCLVSGSKDYLRVLQKYNNKGLMAWWDIANTYDAGDFVDESFITCLKPYIKYLHLKDKTSADGQKYVSLGTGFINYKRILTDLVSITGANTFASIETHVHSDKIQATRKSLIYLRSLLRKPRVSYALVGAGRVTKNYSRAFKENINSELRGVFDIDIPKAKTFASQNDIRVYKTLNELLSDPSIKVVSICTPHNTHIEIAKKAINNGKIVLSEKPFALNSKKLRVYLKDKEAAQKTYVVFQNLFNEPVQKLLKNIKKDKFGKLEYIAANIRWCRDDDYFKDWHGKVDLSGGSLFNQAIHSIQLILMLADSQIKRASYKQEKLRKGSEVEDLGFANFEFKNGISGYLELCLVNKGGNLESSLYVVGNKGSMKIDGRSLSNLVYEYFDGGRINSGVKPGSIEDIYGNGHTFLIGTLSNKLLRIDDRNNKYLIRAQDLLPTIQFIERLYGNSK